MCNFAEQIAIMTEKELKDENPWKEVAMMILPDEKDCLFREEDKEAYVCENDRCIINEFNKNFEKGDSPDRIITNTPPEPWRGNPLKANLIILSLNPGYTPEINETIAKLIQSNDHIRTLLANYRKKTLELKADSFLPEDEKGDDQISCAQAEDMLSGWYWTKRLKTLQEELVQECNMSKTEFFRKVAVIEYHGYSSTTAARSFPNKPLPSQKFTIKLIKHIAYRKDVCFLIMRSKDKWEKLLVEDNIWGELDSKGKLIFRKTPGRSQYITNENLKDCNCENGNGYEKIKELLKN